MESYVLGSSVRGQVPTHFLRVYIHSISLASPYPFPAQYCKGFLGIFFQFFLGVSRHADPSTTEFVDVNTSSKPKQSKAKGTNCHNRALREAMIGVVTPCTTHVMVDVRFAASLRRSAVCIFRDLLSMPCASCGNHCDCIVRISGKSLLVNLSA